MSNTQSIHYAQCSWFLAVWRWLILSAYSRVTSLALGQSYNEATLKNMGKCIDSSKNWWYYQSTTNLMGWTLSTLFQMDKLSSGLAFLHRNGMKCVLMHGESPDKNVTSHVTCRVSMVHKGFWSVEDYSISIALAICGISPLIYFLICKLMVYFYSICETIFMNIGQ